MRVMIKTLDPFDKKPSTIGKPTFPSPPAITTHLLFTENIINKFSFQDY